MIKPVLVTLVLVILSLWGTLFNGCTPEKTVKLAVVTSTSLLESIVKRVGGNRVEVVNLVPPNQHPGNFDVKPGDIQKLAAANLLLLHGWPGEGYTDRLLSSANNPKIKVVKANIDGNWMIPSVQVAATAKIAQVLIETDPQNAAAYQNSAETYISAIKDRETSIKRSLSGLDPSKLKVIAAARQADFLQWAGFAVVASFTTPQTQSPQAVKDLADKGKAAGVKLVINNLQDGKDAGQAIAQEIGAVNLNLSNFPGGFVNTETWEKAIDYNLALLLEALLN